MEESRIEASLGGRVTAAEIAVLSEELRDVIETLSEQPYLLLLDYSRAHSLDGDASAELCSLKDFCLAHGAGKIVSVVLDDDAVAIQTELRIQPVLEGRETIVAQGDEYRYLAPVAVIDDLRRAA